MFYPNMSLNAECVTNRTLYEEELMGSIRNHSVLVTDPPEDQDARIVSDVWIGVVLILMILSCLGCVCSCLLYHKFQQWKLHGSSSEGSGDDVEGPRRLSNESLPSYTLVTGLPTYEQAVERAKLGSPPTLFVYPTPDLPPPPAFTQCIKQNVLAEKS